MKQKINEMYIFTLNKKNCVVVYSNKHFFEDITQK